MLHLSTLAQLDELFEQITEVNQTACEMLNEGACEADLAEVTKEIIALDRDFVRLSAQLEDHI